MSEYLKTKDTGLLSTEIKIFSDGSEKNSDYHVVANISSEVDKIFITLFLVLNAVFIILIFKLRKQYGISLRELNSLEDPDSHCKPYLNNKYY